MIEYTRAEKVSLRLHPFQDWAISILEQGSVVMKAGRLDLLLQDANQRRYEVEIQLGATDESHIIRTIEYWDIAFGSI